MRGVVYEHQAAAAVDTAKVLWRRLNDAVEVCEWALIRDPGMGIPVDEGSCLRMVVFQGASSVGIPTIEIVFEDTGSNIIFHDLEFRK